MNQWSMVNHTSFTLKLLIGLKLFIGNNRMIGVRITTT